MPVPPAAYPRADGVIIPASLFRAGFPGEGGAAAAATWLSRSLRHLPDELLEIPFPDPGAILANWRLAARTQGALARIGEIRCAWTLRHYARRPRMGPMAILDLLAAREENEHPEMRTPVAPAPTNGRPDQSEGRFDLGNRADALMKIFREHLPARAGDLGEIIVAAGLTKTRPRVGDLARAFRERGLPVPFRVVRRLGGTVLVGSGSLASAEALLRAAGELVFHWGVCTLETVVERLRSLSAPQMTSQAATRLLRALPRVRWLDENSTWFSFEGSGGRVGAAIRKIFTAVERVPFDDLARALAKRVKVLAAAPKAALAAYLVKVGHCEVTGEWVRAGIGFEPLALDRGERTIVEVFRRAGGELTTAGLRARAAAAGVKVAAIRHFVRTSPLVIAERGRLRLPGLPRGLASAVPGGRAALVLAA